MKKVKAAAAQKRDLRGLLDDVAQKVLELTGALNNLTFTVGMLAEFTSKKHPGWEEEVRESVGNKLTAIAERREFRAAFAAAKTVKERAEAGRKLLGVGAYLGGADVERDILDILRGHLAAGEEDAAADLLAAVERLGLKLGSDARAAVDRVMRAVSGGDAGEVSEG